MVSPKYIALLAFLSLAASTMGQQAVEPPEKPLRELFVPFEELDVLLGGNTNRVYMNREEFQELLRQAKVQPQSELPIKIVLLSADYQATVDGPRASVHGELLIETLAEGLHALPLQFAGVGILSATLDDQPAGLAKDGSGQTLVFAEGVGKHRLKIELVTPVAIDAAQQTLSLQLPAAPTGKLSLKVPGNVEIKSGAEVVRRTVDNDADATQFDILLSGQPLAILLSLNNKKLREESTVISRGVVVAEVTQGYERLHATMSMGVLNGAIDEFRFAVADDLEVNSVTSEQLSRWSVETVDGQKQLIAKLRGPTSERVVINVRLDRLKPELAEWHLPRFEPLDVAGYSAVVGILCEDRLNASDITADSLIPIDSTVLTAAIPSSLLAADGGSASGAKSGNELNAPQLKAIAAYYAAQPKFELAAQFTMQPRKLYVSANTILTFGEQGITASGGFALMPSNEKLFYFDFNCPANWNINWVRASDGRELRFNRFTNDAADANQATDVVRIRVLLPDGVASETQFTILFQAEHTPDGWLSDWESQSVTLPHFTLLDADTQVGAVAVSVEDDLTAVPETTSGLLVMNGEEKAKFHLAEVPTALAYRYDANDWQATLKLSRVAARVTSHVLSFLQLNPESLVSHTELITNVEQARMQQLTISLPESTPTEIAITGLNGVLVKETASTIVDGRRLWSVQLAERQSGSLRLAIDFTQELDVSQPLDLTLPLVRAEQVDYQSGVVAVEGDAELEAVVSQHPRAVDIGELVDAQYQVGKRLLGVFGYVAEDDNVVVNVSRIPVHRLPATIVQRAEMVSVLSTQGVVQTAARFQLRTKSAYIEVRLPEDAELWSAMLDGKPALPQREQDRVLIALPALQQTTARDLQLVYETSSERLVLRGEVDVIAPELRERAADLAEGLPIPLADLKWELYLPSGYQVTAIDGNLSSNESQGRFTMEWLLNQLWELGGGRVNVLPSVKLSSAPTAGTVATLEDFAAPSSGPVQLDSEFASAAKSLPQEPFGAAGEMQDPFGSPVPEKPMPPKDSLTLPTTNAPAAPMVDSPSALPQIQASPQGQTSPAMEETAKSGKPDSSRARGKQWAFEGVRSLSIALSENSTGERVALSSLGTAPRAQVTILNKSRLHWLALAIGVAVFCFGILCKSTRGFCAYLFFSLLIVCIAPPITGFEREFAPITSSVFAAVLALVAWRLVASIAGSIRTATIDRTQSQRPSSRDVANGSTTPAATVTSGLSTTALLFIAFVLSGSNTAIAQKQQAAGVPAKQPGTVISSPEQLAALLSKLGESGKVNLPMDAIVIPYDSAGSIEGAESERILVPYENYVQLWNRAHPSEKIASRDLPAEFAWSNVTYAAKLESGESLQMTGTMTLEQFTEREIAIPLSLSGCVLEKVEIDGKPPRLQMIEVEPQAVAQPAQQQVAIQQPRTIPGAMFMLYSSGVGKKKLELTLRWKVEKSSGWRSIEGLIPSSPAGKLILTAPQPRTEIRFSGTSGQSVRETNEGDESIETALPNDGSLAIQWRDKISEAAVDQALTVQSRGVFDVQEDSLKFAWHGNFEFRRGRRESFTLLIPSDYLIEKVVGNNIRGWTAKPNESKQQLEIELLKPITERETFSLFISKQSAIDPTKLNEIDAPQIVVPGAMLQQGHVTVRRSVLFDLRTSSAVGISRIDAPDESSWLAGHEEAGPLALRVYQAYRFSQVPFDLKLTVSGIESKLDVIQQTLLKISQRERSLETRLLIKPADRAIYNVKISLPAEWKLQTPSLPGRFQWSVAQADGRQTLQIHLADGQAEQFPIVLRGEVAGALNADGLVELPNIQVLNAQRQSGSIVVQADPAYDVRTENLQGSDTALLNTVTSWLAPKQRESARTVIRFSDAGYSGSVRLSMRTPIVSSFSVTNVKVTDRAIEETVFIEANIRAAGIREFTFLLPASFSNARINAPLLQQKLITPVADQSESVRVQLLLQDEIMGQFCVVVEHDRVLTDEQHFAPIPIIETGTTIRRLVTLENAGRDELVTQNVTELERIERSQLLQNFQADLLGGKSSEAFLVRDGSASPSLSYGTKAREILNTVGARIGLAQSLIVVDEVGTYRAKQEFRVENRTEPFLEVEMPEYSRLWTVQVAGESVKPAEAIVAAGTTNSQRIRIPLVKTAEGELDYAVVLKYGGQIPMKSWMSRIEFPLIRTININVELSQVRLRLPEDFDWFNFDGTLGRVESEADLQAGWLSFRTRQLSELTQLLDSSQSMNLFSKARATNNLKMLEDSLNYSNSYLQSQSGSTSEELTKQLSANSTALGLAQQQIAELDTKRETVSRGNRAIFNDLFEAQSNGRAYNVLEGVGENFDANVPKSSDGGASQTFSNDWLAKNKLQVIDGLQSKPERLSDEESVDGRKKGNLQDNAPVVVDEKALARKAKKDSGGVDKAELDAVSQVQRYDQRLQAQTAIANNANAANEYFDRSGPEAAQSGMIADESKQSRTQTPALPGGMGSGMGGAAMGGGMGGYGMAGSMTGGQQRDMAGRELAAGQPQNGLLDADGTMQLFNAPVAAFGEGYLASLDLELPVRGREYLFSTPRGDVQLSAQRFAKRDYQRAILVAGILIVAAILWGLYRLATQLLQTVHGTRLLTVLLALVGIVSLLSGTLPIYGCLALLAAVAIPFVARSATPVAAISK